MIVFAVRSFGIIGGGAVLFGASAIAGQAILGTLGEIQNIILPMKYLKLKICRNWRNRSGCSSWSNSRHLFSSVVHGEIGTMLSSYSTEGKGDLSKILLDFCHWGGAWMPTAI